MSSFKTLEFWPYFFIHKLSDLILPNLGILAIFIKNGILILFFQLLEIWCYFYRHWNSDLPTPYKSWYSDLCFQTLQL